MEASRGKGSKRRNKDTLGNRLALIGITIVILSFAVVIHFGSNSLKQKNIEYQAREEELSQAVADEESRAAQLDEYRIYVQTKQYVEKIAQEKLGLVKKGEILFKPEEAE